MHKENVNVETRYWTPTDEQVEKAAEEVARAVTEFNSDATIPHYSRHIARAVLVAVGPTIAADAWDVGVAERRMEDGSELPVRDNPYRKGAGR